MLEAELVRVVDGDTIDVRVASGPITIRLHGIDAPERDQPLGAAATKALRSLIEGRAMAIEPVEQRDGYGRMIAKVFVADEDVNARMVDIGYAWAYRRYLRLEADELRYCELEGNARAARRGVWSSDPGQWLPPWDFRARQRGESAAVGSYADESVAACIAAIGRPALRAAAARRDNPAPPGNCLIKGNISRDGKRRYHLPGGPSYDVTHIDVRRGERWFCAVEEAERAGWRPAFP